MYRKVFVVMFVILSLLRVEMVYSMEPLWDLWGNPEYVRYDVERHVYINSNSSIEAWRRVYDDSQYDHLRKPEEVPVKKKVIVVFRADNMLKPESTHLHLFMLVTITSNRRFVLINVEQTILDATGEQDKQYRVWPHLGMLYVGTVAHEEGWDVVLWDESVQGYADLPKLIKQGDVVGFSLVVTGIERGIRLAREAKILGASYVIAGNDSAIFRAPQILALPDKPINAVFTSNGLTPVRLFFRNFGKANISELQIPNLALAPQGRGRSNVRMVLLSEREIRNEQEQRGTFDLEDIFIVPKLDLFPEQYWEELWSNYRHVFGHKHKNGDVIRNGLALFANGCTRTGDMNVCSYCSIAGVADIRIPTEDYLRRTLCVYEDFGIRMIFNTTDSAYEMQPLIKRLRGIGASLDALTIYGRAQGITRYPELLDEWLSIVNDRLLINVGMDSANENILDRGVFKSSARKTSLVKDNHEAVYRIHESGAHLHYSLIFGSPGETIESCEQNIQFLEWSRVVLGPQLDCVETDVFWLNFGAPASEIFTNYEYAQKLAALAGKEITKEQWAESFAQHSQDLIVPESAERAWYYFFTQIDFDLAQEYNQRVKEIMMRHDGGITGRAFKPPKAQY